MHTPGPTAEHSLSLAHARHVSVVALQIGVVPAHSALLVHVTHWPANVPLVAHAVLPSVRPAQRAAVQPAQTLPAQNPLATLAVHPPLSTHSTHWPAAAPFVAHAGFAPLQAFAPALWQPVQALLAQKPFAASFVQSVLSTHSTHWPTAVPVVAQTKPAPLSTFPPQRAAVHAVHALFTQKLLAGFFEHSPSPTHSTHLPAAAPVVAQTAAPPSMRVAHKLALQPVQTLPTQKPLAGSVQSLSAPHVPAASGTRVSTVSAATSDPGSRASAVTSAPATSMGASATVISPALSTGIATSTGITGASGEIGPSTTVVPPSPGFLQPGRFVPSHVHTC
jgi:hypothetical protein